jgi:hypothetical protein
LGRAFGEIVEEFRAGERGEDQLDRIAFGSVWCGSAGGEE